MNERSGGLKSKQANVRFPQVSTETCSSMRQTVHRLAGLTCSWLQRQNSKIMTSGLSLNQWLAVVSFIPLGPHVEVRWGRNNILLSQNKAAELDGSARIWLCTPQQTSTEALTFGLKSTVVQCHANCKAADAPTPATNFCSACSVINKPNPNTQWPAATMMTSLKADEMGASVTPGTKTLQQG